MATAALHNETTATREAILDAAQTRLLRFGYHKTTMSEIAEDAGMSAANLYRHFRNKQDIVAECTARCIDERLERLRAVVDDPALDAASKLERYALELVDDGHALIGPDSMVGELVDTMLHERPDLLRSKIEIHDALIERILNDGVRAGEFAIADVPATARAIFTAFAMFDSPVFVGLFDRAEFDRRAAGVAAALVNGLKPRA